MRITIAVMKLTAMAFAAESLFVKWATCPKEEQRPE
jgi:hypothetical protein